jgi:hypothetical protein
MYGEIIKEDIEIVLTTTKTTKKQQKPQKN